MKPDIVKLVFPFFEKVFSNTYLEN